LSKTEKDGVGFEFRQWAVNTGPVVWDRNPAAPACVALTPVGYTKSTLRGRFGKDSVHRLKFVGFVTDMQCGIQCDKTKDCSGFSYAVSKFGSSCILFKSSSSSEIKLLSKTEKDGVGFEFRQWAANTGPVVYDRN
jgi:hypothetical protein